MREALPFVALLICGCASAGRGPAAGQQLASLQSAEALEIARLEDARLLGEGRIEALTRAAAPAVRARALLALARLQAPETAGVVAAALDDPEPEVRSMAVFALGELGLAWAPIPEESRALAEARLLQRLGSEGAGEVREAIVEALGKVGGQASLAPLTKEGTARSALAVAVLAKSSDGKLVDSLAMRLFADLLSSRDEADRFAGAYGMMRYRDPGGRSALSACLSDGSFAVRALCGRALGSLGTASDVERVAPLLSDPEERVAAEVARALARLLDACPGDDCPALQALSANREAWRPAVASAVSAEPVTTVRALGLFAAQYEALGRALQANPASALARSTLARTQCEVALSHDRILGKVALLSTCGGADVAQAERGVKAARALSESKAGRDEREAGLLALTKSPAARVRAATAAGLAELGDGEAKKAVLELLGDSDWLVAAEAAGAVEAARMAEAGPALVSLLERARGEPASDAAQAALSAASALHVEAALPVARRLVVEGPPHVRQAAARAVGALTGAQPKASPPPWEPGPYAGEPLRRRLFVRLVTERGTVRLQLHPEESPMTVRNFVHLVRQGFFKGLTFHRVVPDFVAQGGDPTGAGSGGPGYTVRCEVNRLRYQTGSVGMALSGKDTGGSQFFVTLSPQPHLDGRYTLFAEVVEGLEAVRALVEGDRILEAQVEPPPEGGNLGTLSR